MMKGMPKKVEVEVEMDGEGEDSPVKGMAEPAMEADEDMFMEMSPKGKFSPKGLMPLVKATNMLLPMFGQTGNYPMLKEAMTQLPTDFVRVLFMFVAAVDDAITNDVVDAEMKLDVPGITDDRGLMLLAAKLDALAKNRDFKKFLKEPGEMSQPNIDEERTPMPEMGGEDAESLMMSRMS